MRPIGFVRSPFTETAQIPKGLGASHAAEGVLEILPELEPGLLDIEGFSHLIVIWVFHESRSYELVGKPATDDWPHGRFGTRPPPRPRWGAAALRKPRPGSAANGGNAAERRLLPLAPRSALTSGRSPRSSGY